MRIVVDENIPLAEHYFAEFGEIIPKPGRSIANTDLLAVDALIVRSVTKVDEQLLKNTPVQFVGSCTIGTDHIDLDYLKSNNIAIAHAPGCNADAVVDYVLACIYKLRPIEQPNLYSVGIVGGGNVGSRLNKRLSAIGFNVKVNDPPLQLAGMPGLFPLEEVMACDIVSLHVPIKKNGAFPSFHLIDKNELACMPANSLLINAARGGVINENALADFIEHRTDVAVALDVWEGEPAISATLAQQVAIATPHIAGYSVEGKVRGTYMIYQALASFLTLPESLALVLPPQRRAVEKDASLRKTLLAVYDPERDTDALRNSLKLETLLAVKAFDQLRKNYPERFEFERYLIEGVTISNSILRAHGFATANEC